MTSPGPLTPDPADVERVLWQHRLITYPSGEMGCACGQWSACQHAKHQAQVLLSALVPRP